MKQYKNTAEFYNGDDWAYCKAQVTEDRIKRHGALYCEHCGMLLTKSFNPKENNNRHAIVYHHKIYLNNSNVNDASISINPNNIAVLCWRCHNIEHNRFNGNAKAFERKVYIVTGPSCSGKTTFVRERLEEGDVVLDIDDLWETVSGQPRYTKPNALKLVIFNLWRNLKEQIAQGVGNWRNAYIIESLPIATDRKREAERYRTHNVELVTMEATKEECLNRLLANPNGRNIEAYTRYIDEYFEDLC